MDAERTEQLEREAGERAGRRERKRRPAMRVSGRGMKRFASPRKRR